MYTTNADYFTFNTGNSVLLVGKTGSGKSYLVHKLIERFERAYPVGKMKYAIFDLKQVEFSVLGEDVKSEYLLFDVVKAAEPGLARLEELAVLAEERALGNTQEHFIFIYIEESDMAVMDQEQFDKAVVTINRNAERANMKLIFSTSRPSDDVVSKSLLHSFDIVLAGPLVDQDYEHLEVPKPARLEIYDFVIQERKRSS